MESLSEYQGTLFLLSQGILAGYAILHMYLIYSIPKHTDHFVCTFAPLANSTRRFFGTFTTLSVVAASSKFLYMKRDALEWKTYPKKQRVLVKSTILLYVIALFFTLLAAPSEAQMYYAYLENPEW